MDENMSNSEDNLVPKTTCSSSSYIHSSEVRPEDVLCRRGSYDNPGNVRFRDLVKPRQEEYVNAKKGTAKTQIAQEIINEFYNTPAPVGRFLQLVEDEGGPRKKIKEALWKEMNNTSILEKVKLALRQKSKSRKKAEKNDKPAVAMEETVSLEVPGETVSTSEEKEEHMPLQLFDEMDLFSSIDLETEIETEVDMEHSSSVNFSPEASSPVSLGNSVHEGNLSEDLRELLEQGRYSPVLAPQHVNLSSLVEPIAGTENSRNPRVPDAVSSNNGVNVGQDEIERQITQQGAGRDQLLISSVKTALHLCKTIRALHEAADASTNVKDDLLALGRTLYQHFSEAVTPSSRINTTDSTDMVSFGVGDSERSSKRRASQNSALPPPLKDMGLPVSLSILVADLFDVNCESAPDRYCSAVEVEEDLVRMVTNPDRYLFDPPVTSGCSQLVFPTDKLYGRDLQSERLMEGFDRVISKRVENRGLLLIAGKSGTGKSTLVDTLRAPLAERRGLFVSCKFDPQGHEQPMSVIFRAFDAYCISLLEGDQAIRADVGWALKQALGPSAAVLKEIVPHLGLIVGGWDSASATKQQVDSETFNRILFCFRTFVRTIAGPTHPVMVLFDDLQFADKASIDLITMLVTDMETSSLLFIGCYRDNDVGTGHPLTDLFGAVARVAVPMSTISLSNLDENSLNDFVSDTLHLPPRLTRSLSESLHTKTGGNPLFVVELLKSLCDEGLIYFSASSRRWKWNIESIREKDIPDIAVDLVLDRMRNYGPEVQLALRVASCLGSRFDAEIMQVLYRDDCGGESSTIADQLGKLVTDGLLVLVDSTYKFTDDQIWQAAYSLTPVEQREETHLQVGRQLLAKLFLPDEMDRMLFAVVGQLNRGSSLLTDHDEKLRVAELNLMAGEKASSASLLLQASIYLLEGTVLVEEMDWESHYDLCLNLFTSCAESQLATGATGISVTLEPVFRHARRLEDSFRANIVLLDTLGNEDRPMDAVNHGLDCAAQIGEIFPESIDLDVIRKEIGKTQAIIQRESISSILQKELMTDEVRLYAMTLLRRISVFTYLSRQELLPMLSCRMIQISLSHGLCPESASAFAALGSAMCNSPQGVERAYAYGKFALAILDRMSDRSVGRHVEMVVYGVINVLKEPIQACIEKVKGTYKLSMFAGDLISSRACAAAYLCSGFQSGCQLESLIAQGRSYMQQLRNCSQKFLDPVCAMYLQLALNLTGPCTDPTYLSGEIVDEEGPSSIFPIVLSLFRMWLAYLFGQYRLAADMMEEQRRVRKGRAIRSLIIVNESFYSSLIAAAMAREERDSRWKEVAKEELEKVQSWAVNSSWNFQHKVELLTAESAWLDGDLETARRFYDAAIQKAERHQFTHEQALACERAGLFTRDTGSPEAAKVYFSRAYRYYIEWGAKMKAEDVMTRYLS